MIQSSDPRRQSPSHGHKPWGFFPQLLLNIVLIAAAALVLGWIAMLLLGRWTHHGQELEVPAVTQVDESIAIDQLRRHGLHPIISDSVFDDSRRPGTVLEQNPSAGTRVKHGREVYLTIRAYSTKRVTVPALTDQSVRQARSVLAGLGITHISEVPVPSDYQGLVLGATADGQLLHPGSRIPVTARVVLSVGSGNVPAADSDSIDSLPEPPSVSLFD